MQKIEPSIQKALSDVKSGDTILVGGFGLVGAPLTLIDGLTNAELYNLTIVSNNLGEPGKGLGVLLNQKKVKKAIGSFFTSNSDVGDKYQNEEIEVELKPQGTMAESIRAGGAGIGGYYTTTSVGTDLSEEKEEREIDGINYVFEKPILGDVALIRAHKSDTLGNLTYHKTARNFNPLMATAAKKVIVEVDEIVEPGELDPEFIITPHLYVDIIVKTQQILTNKGVIKQ